MLRILLAAGALCAATPVFASSADKKCLADVIYAEARGESRAGQVAVAEVVMNRVESPHFPKTVCSVVRQKGQFAPKARVSERAAYETAKAIANEVYEGRTHDATRGATYFHTPAVKPDWSHRFTRTAKIGSHIFYTTRTESP